MGRVGKVLAVYFPIGFYHFRSPRILHFLY
jgi:hypothetical protein